MRRDTVTPAKILPVIKVIGAANLTGDFARAGRCIKRYIFDCNWPPRCIRIGRGVSARCRANARRRKPARSLRRAGRRQDRGAGIRIGRALGHLHHVHPRPGEILCFGSGAGTGSRTRTVHGDNIPFIDFPGSRWFVRLYRRNSFKTIQSSFPQRSQSPFASSLRTTP